MEDGRRPNNADAADPKMKSGVLSHLLLTMILMSFCTEIFADGNVLDGEWANEEWGYGFRIEGNVGRATHWTNTFNPDDSTGAGDIVLSIEVDENGSIRGQQLFYDGRWVEISGKLLDKDTMLLTGSRSEWIMTRGN